jgi:molybdopterin synthase sulfur carrier subunit
MKVRVRAFAQFRELIGSDRIVILPEEADVYLLLLLLSENNVELEDALFDREGKIRKYVIIMMNRRRVGQNEVKGLKLTENDEIAIFPPVAGG